MAKSGVVLLIVLAKGRVGEETPCLSTGSKSTRHGPTVTLEIADPSGPKTIVHYLGCRGSTAQAALIEVEQNLGRVFGTGRFTGLMGGGIDAASSVDGPSSLTAGLRNAPELRHVVAELPYPVLQTLVRRGIELR